MNALSVDAIVIMAATVAFFWLLPHRWPQLRWALVSAAGFASLAYFAPQSAILLSALVVSSFALVRFPAGNALRYLYAAAAFGLLLVLRPTMGGGAVWFGAAFYILRVIHVMIEVARGAIPQLHFLDYLAYMAFLPTLPLGPVERQPWFQREMLRWRWNPSFFTGGLETMLYGYVQITFLANYFVDQVFWSHVSVTASDTLRDWMECLRYGASLYFKFAGYSDIAIGFALLLGIRIRENFNRPYLSANIADFWRRWNISVTSWCREYVNLPALALTRNRSIAALASMIVLGLWHEVSLRYLLWGVFNGIGMAVWRGWRSIRDRLSLPASRLESITAWALTMVFVVAGFAITKEDSVSDSLRALLLLVGFDLP
ncbi:MAG TPA: MBOAT family O-acyltransferase [Dongiaceae bacterium]|nr:MBOAT family O-acyltransferase [Dongiaceae bacterium]